MENKNIFIVEDDAVIMSGLEAKFSSIGARVATSIGDEEITSIVKKIILEKSEIVILDLVLPNVDGFKLLKAVKEEVATVLIFVFSDFSQKDVETRCANLGADYYYLKQDFNTDEFAEKVVRIIKNKDKLKK